MCGIVGFIREKEEEANVSLLKKALETIQHRGPDFKDIFHYKNYYTAHSRLKIIDLSDEANQPFVYKDRLVVSYNGELYNFKSLKNTLEAKGHLFSTNSDTEVLAAAFLEWNTKAFEKFDGMFAIAIFDKIENKLYLARDIFGKKPLYYSHGSIFSFASELNAFEIILNKITINPIAINHFLAIGYILHPYTLYQEVNALPPASFLVHDLENKTQIIQKYYDYSEAFSNKLNLNEEDFIATTEDLLLKAIEKRLVGDVPAGIFLSGGIDSAGIAGILKKHFKVNIPCYTISFEQTRYSELQRAQEVIQHLDLPHSGIDMTFIQKKAFERYIHQCDYTTFDNSSYPIYKLAERAKNEVKFVLTGDGSDEVFGGYATYKADALNQKLKPLIPILKKSKISKIMVRLTQGYNDKVGFATKINRFFDGFNTDFKQAHYAWRTIFNMEERIALLGEENREMIMDTDPFHVFSQHYNEVKDLELKDQNMYVDSQTWLTDNNLVKVDRNTMANGLEARCPYLDKDLTRFLAQCPVHLKKDKYLLKQVLKKYLPKGFLKKPKVGFNSPVHLWFNTNENEFKFYTSMIFENKWKKLLKSQ